MMIITLPWPPTALSPNTRHAHWSQLARAKRQYRAACYLTAKSQGCPSLAGHTGQLSVHLRFVPPDRRLRDLDNLIASMKSGLDGLADALGVDDNRWRLSADLPTGEIGGMVRVEVTA